MALPKKYKSFYLVGFTTSEKPFLVSLDSKSISQKSSDIAWMKKGQARQQRFIYAERVGKNRFLNEEALEEFTIDLNKGWTKSAWQSFLDEFNID